jgi:hypothetical protein
MHDSKRAKTERRGNALHAALGAPTTGRGRVWPRPRLSRRGPHAISAVASQSVQATNGRGPEGPGRNLSDSGELDFTARGTSPEALWRFATGTLAVRHWHLAIRHRRDSETMAQIILRVLDGADRGRVYDDLQTPVTIGREEGNSLQLNDERVSRFHVKIQEDQDKIVITDLESTNGSKVNGEDIQLRILRFGDIVSIGRSVLLFGSREQIAGRLAELRGELSGTVGCDEEGDHPKAGSLEFELNWSADPDVQSTLHTLLPPDLPERLSPGQAAQLCELLEYLHVRVRDLLASVAIKPDAQRVHLEQRQWQNLIDVQARLAGYLRAVGQPHDDD